MSVASSPVTERRGRGAVLRNLTWKALSLGVERGCRLAVTVAAAPVLGEAAFGRFVFAGTVAAFLSLAADLGLGLWTTRALARGRPDASVAVGVGLMLRAAATVPFALAIVAVALTVATDTRSAVVLLGAAAQLNAFTDHFGAVLRGSERFATEARVSSVRGVLMVVAGAGALLFGRTLTAVCFAMGAAAAGSFVYGLIATLRVHPLVRPAQLFEEARPLIRGVLRESLPLWIAGLLSLLYFKVDTVFMRELAGDAELGAYGAAYRLFEGAMLLPSVVLAATFPRLVRAGTDLAARDRLERQIAGGLLVIGLAVAAILFFGRELLVALLFGAQFHPAVASLRILALGIPLVFLNYGLTHFLVARHREQANTGLSVMMLIVTVVLDAVLIPRGAGPGAALATVVAEVALTAGCLLLLRASRTEPPPPSVRAASRTDQTPE